MSSTAAAKRIPNQSRTRPSKLKYESYYCVEKHDVCPQRLSSTTIFPSRGDIFISLTSKRSFFSSIWSRDGVAADEEDEPGNQTRQKDDTRNATKSLEEEMIGQTSYSLIHSQVPFTDQHWSDAERCLRFMLDKGDRESFKLAADLMDRCAAESNARTRLTPDLISHMLECWLNLLRDKSTNAPKNASYMKNSNMFERLREFHVAGIPLQNYHFHLLLQASAMNPASRSPSASSSKKPTSKGSKSTGESGGGTILASEILDWMMRVSKQDNPRLRPTATTFNLVLQSLTKGDEQALEKALETLEQFKALSVWGPDMKVDRLTYRHVLFLAAKQGKGDLAEKLVQELYDTWKSNGRDPSQAPTASIFNLVIFAWSSSDGDKMEAAQRATTILDTMLELEDSKEIPGFRVTAECFHLPMLMWAKLETLEGCETVSAMFEFLKGDGYPKKSQRRPLGDTYCIAIGAWANHDIERSMELLEEYKELPKKYLKKNNKKNTSHHQQQNWNRVLKRLVSGWYHLKHPNAATEMQKLLKMKLPWQPNMAIYNMVVGAVVQQNNHRAMEEAEKLLEELMGEAAKQKGKSVDSKEWQVCARSFAPIIHGWSRLGNMERAEKYLDIWKETCVGSESNSANGNQKQIHSKDRLDRRTFNKVFRSYIRLQGKIPDASDRLESLLLRMERDYGVEPNRVSFEYALECRSQSKSSTTSPRKEELIRELDRLNKKSGRFSTDDYSSIREQLLKQ